MSSRLVKQLLYGGGYLVFFGLIVFGAYLLWLKPAPSCFDNKQNGNETGVDCGGSCIPCEIKRLSPVEASWVKVFPEENSLALVAELRNSNQEYGARFFSYRFEAQEASGATTTIASGASFIYAGEIKYLLALVNQSLASGTVALKITDPQWAKKIDFDAPITQLRAIQTVGIDNVAHAVVNGFVTNQNPYPLSRVALIAFAANKNGAVIGVSRTELDNLAPFTEIPFAVEFPKTITLPTTIELPRTYTFDKNLKQGDKGPDVQKLQQFLIVQGFLNRTTTDYFGPATKRALIAYQKTFHLVPANGFLGQKTRAYINNLAPLTPPSTPTPNEADPAQTKIYVEAIR